MLTIWKYKLSLDGPTTISIPYGCKVAHVGMRDNDYYIWIRVNTDRVQYTTRIFLLATGVPLIGGYLGTILDNDGVHVWHVCGEGFDSV